MIQKQLAEVLLEEYGHDKNEDEDNESEEALGENPSDGPQA